MTQQSKKQISTPATDDGMTAEKAMNIVLEAEQQAREAVESCKTDAETLLQQARQKSQRIGKRVDDRITRIHQRIARVVTDQVKKLAEEEKQLAKQENVYTIEHDVVEVVVDQIAEMLTSPDQTSSEKTDGINN